METTPHDRTYTAAELNDAAQIVARQLMAEGVPEADACRAASLAAVDKAGIETHDYDPDDSGVCAKCGLLANGDKPKGQTLAVRPFGIWRSNFPRRPRWFATRAARDQAFAWVAGDTRFEHRKIVRSLVPCAECGGETIPPDPASPAEEHHYCETCGRTTAA